MIIGALLGSLLGLGGKSLDEIKESAIQEITHGFSKGIDQVIDLITRWVARAKAELHEAALASFYANCCKLDRLIAAENPNVLRLTYKSPKSHN
jgi:hypothetical protein